MTLFPPDHATSPGLTRRGLLAAASAPLLMSVADARAQGIAPKRGGTLTSLLTPEPPILVLGVNGQGPTLIVGSKIYQGLITYSPTLQPIGVLAKSWTISDDKLVYTFNLQEGVTFHDGHPFTAEDVVFSVMEFAMTLSTRARSVFSMVEKAEALDPLTVRFILKQPYAPFLLAFVVTGVPMMPKHIFAGTDYRTNPHNSTPIGTGPSDSPIGRGPTSFGCNVTTATGRRASHIWTRSFSASCRTARAGHWRCRPGRCSSPRQTTSSRSTCLGFASRTT